MAHRRARLVEEDGCQVRMIHLERVQQARSKTPDADWLDRLARIFKALANPTRLTMVIALADGEMCVCDLAALVGQSDSVVSHHLRRLKDLDLLRSRRDGPILYYALDDDHVAQLLDAGLEHVIERGR